MLRLEDVITTILFFYLYQEHDLRILGLGFSSGFVLFFVIFWFILHKKKNKLENEMF